MARMRSEANLLIISVAACLSALPMLGDAAAQTMMPVDSYGAAPYQATSAHSLGTLSPNEMNNPQPSNANQMAPSYTQQQALQAADLPLQPVQAGNITYITGGIGDEERDELHAVEKDYNMRVMSASHDGAFVGDTHIVIDDTKGNVLLDASAGPLFYAKLPAGSYVVEATHNGTVKKQTVAIRGSKTAFVHLGW